MKLFFGKFAGNIKAAIPSSVSFASIRCVRNVVVLEVDRESMVSLIAGLV